MPKWIKGYIACNKKASNTFIRGLIIVYIIEISRHQSLRHVPPAREELVIPKPTGHHERKDGKYRKIYKS